MLTERRSGDAATEVVFGAGSVRQVARVVCDVRARTGAGRPVLVVCGTSSRARRWRSDLIHEVAAVGPAEICEHGPGEVTEATVQAVARAGRGIGAGLIVAAGGGTVLDAAKVASLRLGGERPLPVVAVPTTPGTGAELTPFATVWDRRAGRKHSVAARGLAPVAAVVDPELTLTLARSELASVALDALCLGVEAAWSTNSTRASTAYGLSAIALVARWYERALADAADARARALLSLAGIRSGRAIAISQTTVCHALSYPLTLRYGLRHGHACAVVLGRVLAYNGGVTDADCRDRRGVAHVRRALPRILTALGAGSADAARRRIDGFLTFGGLPVYDELGVDSPEVAREALTYSRAANNPRALDARRLAGILA
jgi:alcohol dehydrogenase class IV